MTTTVQKASSKWSSGGYCCCNLDLKWLHYSQSLGATSQAMAACNNNRVVQLHDRSRTGQWDRKSISCSTECTIFLFCRKLAATRDRHAAPPVSLTKHLISFHLCALILTRLLRHPVLAHRIEISCRVTWSRGRN